MGFSQRTDNRNQYLLLRITLKRFEGFIYYFRLDLCFLYFIFFKSNSSAFPFNISSAQWDRNFES